MELCSTRRKVIIRKGCWEVLPNISNESKELPLVFQHHLLDNIQIKIPLAFVNHKPVMSPFPGFTSRISRCASTTHSSILDSRIWPNAWRTIRPSRQKNPTFSMSIGRRRVGVVLVARGFTILYDQSLPISLYQAWRCRHKCRNIPEFFRPKGALYYRRHAARFWRQWHEGAAAVESWKLSRNVCTVGHRTTQIWMEDRERGWWRGLAQTDGGGYRVYWPNYDRGCYQKLRDTARFRR